MKKIALILLALVLFAAIPPFMAQAATIKKTAKKAPVVKTVKKPAPKKGVKGLLTIGGTTYVSCSLPDGKVAWAPKKTCDFVTEFWNKNKPSNPGPSNSGVGGGGSTGGSNNGGGSSPVTPKIDEVTLMACGSTSCGIIKTVKVDGSNFSSKSRVELSANGLSFGENTSFNYSPDAQLVGGNGSTQIIMDFFNLPASTTYGVLVRDGESVYTTPITVSTP